MRRHIDTGAHGRIICMFVHNVYFWLHDTLTDAERRAFGRGLDRLLSIDSIERSYRGVPADTDRPVIDRTYSMAIVVVFRDRAAHDAYQSDPKHDRFRDECGRHWRRVQIYDFVA